MASVSRMLYRIEGAEVNLIDEKDYVKDCPLEDLDLLETSVEAVRSLALHVMSGVINIRVTQGVFVKREGIDEWIGDHLFEVAFALLADKISPLEEGSSETLISERIRLLLDTQVVYVSPLGKKPSETFLLQVDSVKGRVETDLIFNKGHYVGVTLDGKQVVMGEKLEAVVLYIARGRESIDLIR